MTKMFAIAAAVPADQDEELKLFTPDLTYNDVQRIPGKVLKCLIGNAQNEVHDRVAQIEERATNATLTVFREETRAKMKGWTGKTADYDLDEGEGDEFGDNDPRWLPFDNARDIERAKATLLVLEIEMVAALKKIERIEHLYTLFDEEDDAVQVDGYMVDKIVRCTL